MILLVGENPLRALRLLAAGAFGNAEAIGYTLYYATNFIFTGLAVAVAFHGGLFNIGAEGQAYIGGLGVGLLCLGAGGWPTALVIPAAVVVAAVFGAGWAFVPAWLQARRGSHVVITTIMFNFIASALMTYLLVNVLIKPGQQSPETREFAPSTWLPQLHEIARVFGLEIGRSPLNLSSALGPGRRRAGLALCLAHALGLRAPGPRPQRDGGRVRRHPARAHGDRGDVDLRRARGPGGLNEIMGVQHRLLLNFPGGAGYVGIAVALMGRNHPVGIVLAAILFGALYQGGSELSFDMPKLTATWWWSSRG